MAGEKKDARSIKYLNFGFNEFVKDLRDFSRVYFPKTSKDLSDASSGQMMLEQGAFIGDILALYLDDRFKNSNMQTAKDARSVFTLARSLGYPLQGPRAASGETNFYLEVPATTGSSGGFIPDSAYFINFKNVKLQNSNGIQFESLEDVDFTTVNISSSLESRVSRRTGDGVPSHFVLKVKGEVTAGKTITQTSVIDSYKPYREVEISEANVLEIESVIDSEGEEWFQVDYHAQEVIFEGVRNTDTDSALVPYNLKLKTVPRRFVAKIDPRTGRTTLRFGPGKATEIGTPFVPDPSEIALDLRGKLTFSPPFIDPQNFLRTRTLGLAPYGTTLTIKARVGGGRITNTSTSGLKDIIGKEVELNQSGLVQTELNNTRASFASENSEGPLLGGDEAETIDEIKQNASAFFSAQGRVNTREDYIARSLSLPAKFGKLFRVYATNTRHENAGVQLYVIAKNNDDQLIAPPTALKKNLKTYLSMFARLNQGIDILNGKIVNIAIEYSVVVVPGKNKTKVKLDTLKKLKDHFQISKWQLNQPVIIDDVRSLIQNTDGVLAIAEFKIINKNNITNGRQYSEEVFSVESKTKNNILFSPTNSIFEVKFPSDGDIKVGAL